MTKEDIIRMAREAGGIVMTREGPWERLSTPPMYGRMYG